MKYTIVGINNDKTYTYNSKEEFETACGEWGPENPFCGMTKAIVQAGTRYEFMERMGWLGWCLKGYIGKPLVPTSFYDDN